MIKKFLKLFGIFLVFILLAKFIYSQGWYAVILTNSQSTTTPAPFQQDIAICNGNINIGPNFAYINNATIFNEIDSNGQNVYFTTIAGSTVNIYSWYEGQENFNGVYCDVWWVKLPNGIPANSNVIIYMYVGNISANYYSQYYPYVGEAPQLSSTYGQYDNGNYVFLFYDNFVGTTLNTNKWSSFTGSGASISINNGITINGGSSYAGVITLEGFNPTSTIADIYITTASNKWPVVSITNGDSASSDGYFALWSGTSDSFYYGSYSGGINGEGFTWNYPAILSESWQSSNQQIYGDNYVYTTESYTTYSLPSLVYYGFGSVAVSNNGYISVQWFRVRAYPPNGVMPSFSVIPALTPIISVNTSTNFQFNVSLIDSYSEYVNYTVYLNGSILTTNNVSVTAGQTLTIPYTYQYLFNQSGTYNLTVIAYGQTSNVTAIATDIFTINIPPPMAYINVNTQSNLLFNVTISDGLPENVNYTIYLNGTQLTNGSVQITLPSITIQAINVTLPFNYTYLLNQSGYYNLSVSIYGNQSQLSYFTNSTFYIQLDQLNVSLQPYYTYNNTNYTNLYNSNLNINYYCMRPNNTLTIYDNITNQTLQYNLSCNYIETPENLFVNLTSILQNNTLNYINGSLTYGTQSFGNISFEPLWDTLTVNLTIYLPQILVYTAPLGMNYTVTENDVLPNVTCNTSFYDNNNLVQTNSSTLTNGSITYSEIISQTPIHNFSWDITCIDPVNVTTSFTYSTGPYYYNEFNLYMEDSGNIPSNVTYSLTLECSNNTVQYSNANDEDYTLYLWTNNQCNFVLISQNIQGITFDEAFSTNLLSNYAFQWPICLINTSLAYYENPLVGSQSYQGTLISVENPQTGCYLTGSYLYLYSSNQYYNSIPMRPGALYAIRVNNTFLTTIQGSQQQAISIDQLIVQLEQQIQSFINVTLTGATINLTYVNGYPELIVQTPYNMSSVYVQLYNNTQFVQSYNLTSINSNIANIIITNPPGFNFTSNQYAILTISYTNGLQQILYYPPFKYYGTINYVISWIVMLALLYEWFSAYQHYWKIIIAIFTMVGALILATFFNVGATPLLFLSGFLAIYLYDFAIKYFVEGSLGDQPLFKFASIFFKIILVMMFVSTVLASFNIPTYGSVFTNIQTEINVAQNIQNALNTIAANPLSFPVEILLLAGYLIYGMFTSASIINALFSVILGFLSPALGPLANILSITISGIVDIAIAVVIITSLWVILFGIGYFKL